MKWLSDADKETTRKIWWWWVGCKHWNKRFAEFLSWRLKMKLYRRSHWQLCLNCRRIKQAIWNCRSVISRCQLLGFRCEYLSLLLFGLGNYPESLSTSELQVEAWKLVFECEYVLVLWTGQEVTDREIESLMSEVEEYVLASHLHWALWGIMSVSVWNFV